MRMTRAPTGGRQHTTRTDRYSTCTQVVEGYGARAGLRWMAAPVVAGLAAMMDEMAQMGVAYLPGGRHCDGDSVRADMPAAEHASSSLDENLTKMKRNKARKLVDVGAR
jgi:hypothetical protein